MTSEEESARQVAHSLLRGSFQERITESLRALLETRHLYQSVRVDHDSELEETILETLVPKAEKPGPHKVARILFNKVVKEEWEWQASLPMDLRDPPLLLEPPDVKLYCTECQRREPFNHQATHTLVRHPGTQVWAMVYVCQSCKGVPEVFLVRRDNLKLTLTGRAPIEDVALPRGVPKQVAKFLVAARLAFRSRQILPALFMLRTVIEQWARFATCSKATSADKLMDEYMARLPTKVASSFPSMRRLYDQLSDSLHLAEESEELYVRAEAEIVQHFEALRVYEVTSPFPD